jgi:AraC-like DNA-binding protein
MGHAGQLVASEGGTLFFSRRGETQGFWNRSAATRLWVLKFDVSSAGSTEYHELLDLPPEKRILKLSAAQQQLFCDILLKIAFAKRTQDRLSVATASAWLIIQLVNVTRWVSARRDDLIAFGKETDLQCFDLWQKIERHAYQARSAEAMQFSKNPSYDSLRHRFQKLFGVSPRGLLVRLRMERAKELLRTTNISIKEIAQELGYSKQHEFTRAFHRFSGMSPNEWKSKADVTSPALDFHLNRTSDDFAIGLQNNGLRESKRARIRYQHSPQILDINAGSQMVAQSRQNTRALPVA